MTSLLGFAILIVVVWILVQRVQNRRSSRTGRDAAKAGETSSAQATSITDSPLRADIETAVQRDYGRIFPPADLRRVERKPTEDHVPPSPSGRAGPAWSPPTQQVEVAGEWYRAENLRVLFTRRSKVSESGAEIRHPAVLVPDPSNPHDRYAVAVFVGVISPTQTANLLPLVRRAESEGRNLTCRASLRGNALKADVALHVRKTHEFDDLELEQLFATDQDRL